MEYGKNNQIIIIIVNIIVIFILSKFLIKNYKTLNKQVRIFGTMVISGGLSNLIDRFARGYVVDYIDINQIYNYPVFNIADIFIVCGIFIIIFLEFRGEKEWFQIKII